MDIPFLYSYSSEEKFQYLPPKLDTFAQLAVKNAEICVHVLTRKAFRSRVISVTYVRTGSITCTTTQECHENQLLTQANLTLLTDTRSRAMWIVWTWQEFAEAVDARVICQVSNMMGVETGRRC
jgi:hypothetical protein